MRFLVTGGAGFIGSHIVEALLDAGHFVRVLDDFSTGKRENLTRLEADVDLIEGDVREPAAVRHAINGIDVVIHQAALPSVPRSIADPVTTNAVNVGGTLNLLDASRRAGVRRFVYASSSSVYGDTPELPKSERMGPRPQSPYAVSKLAAEQYCRVYASIYNMATVALRYFNVFGPRQDPDSPYSAVIPRFIHAILRGDQPVIYGDGEQSRDFTFVANVVDANLRAATAACEGGLAMNVACGSRITLNQLVRSINEIAGMSVAPRFEQPRPGDVRDSLADIGLARRELGYRPAVGLDEGLRQTVAYYRKLAPVMEGAAYGDLV